MYEHAETVISALRNVPAYETIKVNDKPPHAPVSTHSNPNDPPDIK